jgi:hypothetical protein
VTVGLKLEEKEKEKRKHTHTRRRKKNVLFNGSTCTIAQQCINTFNFRFTYFKKEKSKCTGKGEQQKS